MADLCKIPLHIPLLREYNTEKIKFERSRVEERMNMSTKPKRHTGRKARPRWPKLALEPSRAAWLSRLAFAVGPLVSYSLVEVLNYNQPWGSFTPLQVALNLVWYYLGAFFFYFVLGRRDRATKVAMLVAWAIGIVNRYAIAFRGRTLFPGDIVTIRTALNVAGNYNYTPDLMMVLTGLCVALFIGVLSLLPAPAERQRFSWKLFLPTLAGSGAFLYFFFCTNAVSDAGISPSMWTTRGNGLALNFSLCLRYSRVKAPDGYGRDALTTLAEEHPSEEAAVSASTDGITRPVNLIVVMNESLSDLSVIPGVETNQDPMPFLHSLEENTVKGWAFSSVFGGTTANSEYEFLTGNTVTFLPAGTVPYHMYVGQGDPSLAGQMESLGYATVAMHPYYSSGWNRVAVYNDYGFDEQYFLEDFDYDESDIIREYLSDRANYENLIARYEAKEEGQPLFLFNVTMQNHSAYTGEWTNLPEEVHLTGAYEGRFRTVDQYLNLVYQSDQAFEYLIDYFSQVEEPTMICMFGDHQPQVATNFYTEALGGEVEALDTDTAEKKQIVPFVIWANYDIPEQQDVTLSLNYLSALLMETAGLPTTGYQDFLLSLWEDLPVINPVGYLDRDGDWTAEEHWEELPDYARESLAEYRILEYCNIFDKGSRPENFYTLDTGG